MTLRESVIQVSTLNCAMAQRLAHGISDELSCREAIPTLAPPRWQFGHLALVAQLPGTLVGGTAILPQTWAGLFGNGTRFQPEAAYPPMAELVAAIDQAHRFSESLLSGVPDEMLFGEMPLERLRGRFPTPAAAFVYMLGTHAGYHLGEVMAWRKAAALAAPPA